MNENIVLTNDADNKNLTTISKYQRPLSKLTIYHKENKSLFRVFLDIAVFIIALNWAILEGIYRLIFPISKKSVEGEIVLVTGAGHGIGKELALLYASKSAIVVCWDINKNNNDETVAEIFKFERTKAYGFVCDVSNRQEIMETAKKVTKEVGHVTILINNAGIMPCHSFLEHTAEEIQQIMNINVMAHFWTLQAFLPQMIKSNRGHIVALSSMAGITGLRNLVPYCASKYAVRGLMEATYEELRSNHQSKIKFTTICPFMVNTGLCKKPVIRFPNLFPLLEPKEVARYIMSMQRRNVLEATVPSYGFYLFSFLRLYPPKVIAVIADFLQMHLDSDLERF